jgi:hypothetical protein
MYSCLRVRKGGDRLSLVDGKLMEGRRGAIGTMLDSGGGIMPRSCSLLLMFDDQSILLKNGA